MSIGDGYRARRFAKSQTPKGEVLRQPALARAAKNFPTLLALIRPALSYYEFLSGAPVKTVERVASFCLIFIHLLRYNFAGNNEVLRAVIAPEIDEDIDVRRRVDFARLASDQPEVRRPSLGFDLD